ncbi:hypothetical protein [Prauserella flavalba]|uniref:hypothetical protein n=1 Tax=Prauserella flavalba TaxID=1477506 RepID=UPI0011B4EE2C|nr:hypothetical protein [Prauserella flavalba]
MSGRRAVPSPLRANTVRVTGSARTDPSGQPRGQRHPRGLEPAAPHGLRAAPVPATVAAVFLGLPPSALGFVVWGYAVARHPVPSPRRRATSYRWSRSRSPTAGSARSRAPSSCWAARSASSAWCSPTAVHRPPGGGQLPIPWASQPPSMGMSVPVT